MFVRLLRRHKARMRFTTGVVDLLSIMVGVILLGILAGGDIPRTNSDVGTRG